MNYPDQWEGTNRTRIDLKKIDEVVLVQKGGRWEPFKLTSWDQQSRKVGGIWLLTGEEVKLNGGVPTYPINEDWIIKYIYELMNERDKISKRIEILKSLSV